MSNYEWINLLRLCWNSSPPCCELTGLNHQSCMLGQEKGEKLPVGFIEHFWHHRWLFTFLFLMTSRDIRDGWNWQLSCHHTTAIHNSFRICVKHGCTWVSKVILSVVLADYLWSMNIITFFINWTLSIWQHFTVNDLKMQCARYWT